MLFWLPQWVFHSFIFDVWAYGYYFHLFFTYLIMICLIFVCLSVKYVYVCLVVAGQSVKTGFLTAYMESLGSTFSNGANFAVVGSSTLPKFVPFALNVQVMQFLHFKSRSNELLSAGNSPNCSYLFTHNFQLMLSIVNFNVIICCKILGVKHALLFKKVWAWYYMQLSTILSQIFC